MCVQRFRGGLVFTAHRLVFKAHDPRLESNTEDEEGTRTLGGRAGYGGTNFGCRSASPADKTICQLLGKTVCQLFNLISCSALQLQRDWYFVAEQLAPAPHLAYPEG